MLKLSDAIRKGSKLRAASESGWNDVSPTGQVRSCAIMAAAEAAGLFECVGDNFVPCQGVKQVPPTSCRGIEKVNKKSRAVLMPDEWFRVTRTLELPPCACPKFGVEGVVLEIIWHLHDLHGWSREAAAEWIEVLEVKAEAQAPEVEVDEPCRSKSPVTV